MLETTNKDQMTVEAPTVEDALAEISAQFGEDAEIMRAQKVHRGGVGGFFAKEMVQLTARRRRTAAPARLRPGSRPQGGGIADVLERMAENADAEDSDFRTVLQRELTASQQTETPAIVSGAAAVATERHDTDSRLDDGGHFVPPFADEAPQPVVVGPALLTDPNPPAGQTESETATAVPSDGDVAEAIDRLEASLDALAAGAVPGDTAAADELPATPETADTGDAPEGMGPIGWSTTALLRLGMPGPIISAVAGLDANDDLGWIDAISRAVAPLCGPLPRGDMVIVGPHAERLAEPLGLPLVGSGDMAPYDGSFCAMVEDSAEDRLWLEFVRGGRDIHLVIGDEPWQELLIGEPVAVSWVGETAAASALYVAFTLGATLGFGTVDGFVSSMVRAQPTDVALAVRRMVRRR